MLPAIRFPPLPYEIAFARVGRAAHMVAGDRNDVFAGAVIAFLARTVPVGGEPVQPAHEPHPRRDPRLRDLNDLP